MMRKNYTFCFFLGAMLCATSLHAQSMLEQLGEPDSLNISLLGDPNAEDYGAVPYGANHLLFASNRNTSATSPKDPVTNIPFPSLYLMRISDRRVTRYPGNIAINQLKYYVGPGALLPDSSAIIMSHSRQKPDSNGDIKMTLSEISFSGNPTKELPFIEQSFNYIHPFFDPESYTLYFASDFEHIGDYDIYRSTLSFDGVWSLPVSVPLVNSTSSEVFPTLLPNQTIGFSRSSRNYGLQLYALELGDSIAQILSINGRGDDMGLLQLNDTTLMAAQSKRKGSVANFNFYSPLSKTKSLALTTEVIDSADNEIIATLESDENTESSANAKNNKVVSTEGNGGVNGSNTSSGKMSWVTDHEPAASTNRGFSLIVGGFIEKQLAYQYLDRISNDWAPKAFLARYNDKYYVVHSIHSTRSEADMAKAAVNNKGNRAWILRSALRKL
jgi:hypothetical protein